MVTKIRRWHSAEFKLRVALEAAKELKSTSKLAEDFSIQPILTITLFAPFLVLTKGPTSHYVG